MFKSQSFLGKFSLLLSGTRNLQINKKSAFSPNYWFFTLQILPLIPFHMGPYSGGKRHGVFKSLMTSADILLACVLQPTSASFWLLWVWQLVPIACGATGPIRPSCLWGYFWLLPTPWPSRWEWSGHSSTHILGSVFRPQALPACPKFYLLAVLHTIKCHLGTSWLKTCWTPEEERWFLPPEFMPRMCPETHHSCVALMRAKFGMLNMLYAIAFDPCTNPMG